MLAAKAVELTHDVGGGELLVVDGHGVALLEGDGDVFRGVWRVLDRGRHHVAFGGRLGPGILKGAALEGDVEEVPVHGIGLLRGDVDGDLVLPGVVDEVRPGLECPVGGTPWRDELDCGIQRVCGEFEADLVVALAGRAVADVLGAFLAGDFHEVLGDQGARNGGAQQVHVLVDGVGLEHREDVVLRKLLVQILDV